MNIPAIYMALALYVTNVPSHPWDPEDLAKSRDLESMMFGKMFSQISGEIRFANLKDYDTMVVTGTFVYFSIYNLESSFQLTFICFKGVQTNN